LPIALWRSLLVVVSTPRRVLGHEIKGVEDVYDRHHYLYEEADALNRLAALIEHIVNPPEANVVTMVRG
jgi:hypothetical protein